MPAPVFFTLIVKYAFIGLFFPLIFLHIKAKESSFKAQVKREERERKIISEYQERMNRKNQATMAERNEKFKQDMIKNSKAKLADVNNDFSQKNKEPKTFKEKINEWYHNLPIIRKLDLQKMTNEEAITMHFDSDDAVKSPFKIIYEYRAKSPEGKFVIDYFDAYSKVEVYSFLINEGYKVFSIRTSKAIQLLHGNLNGSSTKFKSKDLIFFLTQLSTYLKAGIPLTQAMEISKK